jgi:hypothetical protein
MKKSMKATFLTILVTAAMLMAVSPLVAQDQPADNMQIMLDKVKADKKLVVAENMGLTEAEAEAFWPVYEEYQKGLAAINERLGKLIGSYAEGYNADTLTDEKAAKLIDESLAISKAGVELQASFVPKLSAVLPARKVMRYIQIENKIRALVNFGLAAEVPLVY